MYLIVYPYFQLGRSLRKACYSLHLSRKKLCKLKKNCSNYFSLHFTNATKVCQDWIRCDCTSDWGWRAVRPVVGGWLHGIHERQRRGDCCPPARFCKCPYSRFIVVVAVDCLISRRRRCVRPPRLCGKPLAPAHHGSGNDVLLSCPAVIRCDSRVHIRDQVVLTLYSSEVCSVGLLSFAYRLGLVSGLFGVINPSCAGDTFRMDRRRVMWKEHTLDRWNGWEV